MTTTTIHGAGFADNTRTGGSFLASVRQWLRQRRVYSETLAELRDLSDRELDDIGIRRADLRRIAREAAEL